jgi:hypothetical protein
MPRRWATMLLDAVAGADSGSFSQNFSEILDSFPPIEPRSFPISCKPSDIFEPILVIALDRS